MVDNTAFIGLENGLFRKFDPAPATAVASGGYYWPKTLANHLMYQQGDAAKHGGELVVESSPCKIGNHIYITCGSGHVYGYNIDKDTVDWDFYIGSDLDGSPVVTADSCLLVTVEKQFIAGRGGLLKLNPRNTPATAVVWYLPVKNKEFATWHGGIIGSAATNDYTGFSSGLAATIALDGNLYVVNHAATEGTDVAYDAKTEFPTPKMVFTFQTGPSISSPIFAGNRLLVAGYTGIYLFEYDKHHSFKLLCKIPGGFESTPICHQGRVYIASRNGYMYCFGRQSLSQL
jgi:outer membrane protein assembly factor BamB